MEATQSFKEIIQKHLNEYANEDKLFAASLQKEGKNIDDCITYILNQVKASGKNGFADEEIYNMARHYYDEDNIKVGAAINTRVVVNQSIAGQMPQIPQAPQKPKEKKQVLKNKPSESQMPLF